MSEWQYKNLIKENLNTVLGEGVIPELGAVKKGKVRDIYFSGDNVIMVASDRVSAFDYTIPNLIPFKGAVLNKITKFAFDNTKDIVQNAVVGDDVDPNVVVQKALKNCGVECIVRGYLWGSMAASYEKGERSFCGLAIPDGLNRFQKFDTPLFTPTTKAEAGAHDENMTMDEVKALVGDAMAEKLKDLSLKLYARGAELAAKQGLMFIDTKYEFGTDEKGELYVIDEINTPDSSRLCDIAEWTEKYPKIAAEMASGGYKNVTEVMAKKPEFKIKEYSKQYVRDLLLEAGFKPGKTVPTLTEEQVIESSFRYISVYERLTGEKWQFESNVMPAPQRVMANLQRCGLATGGCVVIMAGSDSDMPHLDKIQSNLNKYGLASHIRICSAHKQPTKLEEALNYYNRSMEPILIVGCAGGTDALSGTASFHSVFPVVSCPPDGMNETCLKNPPGSSNAFCVRPDNVAKFACQAFSHVNPKFKEILLSSNAEKVAKLVKADKFH